MSSTLSLSLSLNKLFLSFKIDCLSEENETMATAACFPAALELVAENVQLGLTKCKH